MSAPGQYTCSFGGYRGDEEAVLAFRNATRPLAEGREYFEWRYHTPAGAPAPVVCWLRGPDGRAAGMAAVIFRRYWYQGRPAWIPVAGDIGLRPELRGQGLGAVLLAGMTAYLRERHAEVPAFVLPTEAARRTLAACGWLDAGRLVPHVFLARPDDWLRARLPGAVIRGASGLYTRVIGALLRDDAGIAARLEDVTGFDDAYDELDRSAPPAPVPRRCLDAAALRWRYAQNPRVRFETTRLMTQGKLAGFVVASRLGDDLHLHDVVAAEPSGFVPLMKGVLTRVLRRADARSLRFALADTHPYRAHLRRLFFIARPAEAATFQVLAPSGVTVPPGPWHITSGDKDI